MNFKKTPVNIVLVNPDPQQETVKLSDVELQIATQHNPYNWSVISGTVIQVPDKLTKNSLGQPYDCEVDILPGDQIFFHHNMINEERKLDEDVYWMQYESIYAYKRDNKLYCPAGHILVDAEMESEEDIKTSSGIFLKAAPEAKYQYGFISVLGPLRNSDTDCDYEYLEQGTRILYDLDSDIPLVIDEHKYYRQEYSDVLGYFSNGDDDFNAMGRRCLVRPKPREEKLASGLFIPDVVQHRPTEGTVLSCGYGCFNGNLIDETVYFMKGAGTPVALFGEQLLFLQDYELLMIKN